MCPLHLLILGHKSSTVAHFKMQFSILAQTLGQSSTFAHFRTQVLSHLHLLILGQKSSIFPNSIFAQFRT